MPDGIAQLLLGGWGAGAAGAVAGVVLGLGIAEANRRLARQEHLVPAAGAVQRWGPPVLLGVVAAALGVQLGWHPVLVIRVVWATVLVQVIFFDLAHRLILDRVLVPAAVLAFLASFVTPGIGWMSALLAGAGAVAVFGGLAFLGRVLLHGEALGMGDVKLVGFIGLTLGFAGAVPALILGVVLAGAGAAVLLVTRRRGPRDTIAYGPFLAIGALLGLFLGGLPPR